MRKQPKKSPTVLRRGLDGIRADVEASLARHAGDPARRRFVELLPYHPWGADKASQTGRVQPVYETPAPGDIESFAAILLDDGIPVKIGGTLRRLRGFR